MIENDVGIPVRWASFDARQSQRDFIDFSLKSHFRNYELMASVIILDSLSSQIGRIKNLFSKNSNGFPIRQ